MADGGALWNRREFSCDHSVFERKVLKKDITEDFVTEVVNKMSVLKRNFAKPALWSQVPILQAVMYKHHNQHRKEKYFQGLKRVHKFLKRLQELEIHKLIAQVMQQFPRIESVATGDSGPFFFPSVQMISHLLVHLMGFAKLALHTITMCEETVKHILGQLALGFFITFHMVSVASLCRFWVLLKDLLQDTIDCYKVTHPWIKLLGEPGEAAELDNANLPECLKTWLAPDSNTATEESITRNSSKKVSTPATSSALLEKLFALTPGLCTPDASPQRENILRRVAERDALQDVTLRSPPAADLGEPVVSLGRSFIEGEIKMQQRKRKETLTSHDEKNMRVKHDAHSGNKRRRLESNCSINPTKSRQEKSDEVREECIGKLLKSEGTLRDMFPRFRTASPTMKSRERCRKLLFRRQCGVKGRSGLTNSLRGENWKAKGSESMVITNKVKKSEEINSKNLATRKKKLGEITEKGNVQNELNLGINKDLDTEATFAPRRKCTTADTKNSKNVELMHLGLGRDCLVIHGSDQERHSLQLQISNSPQVTLGNACLACSSENTDKRSPAQMQRTKGDYIDDIFSLLEM